MQFIKHSHHEPSSLSSSLISVPLPEENCICSPRNRFKKRKPNGEESNYEEEVIRQAMDRLTIKEQELAEAVVRGNSDIATTILERQNNQGGNGFAEEPAFLSLKFEELERNLRACVITKQAGFEAYEMARRQDSTYVDCPDFKIGFLRADRYDAQKAAQRMLRYFSEKLDMFGPKTLARALLWEDLGADDGQWYHEQGGGYQILPKRDSAGRLVIFFGENLPGREIPPSRIPGIIKAIFYFFATLGDHDDEMGRVKGVTSLMWRVHTTTSPDPKLLLRLYRMRDAVPVKISAFHYCHHSPALRVANDFAKMTMPSINKNGIIRYYKSHYGTEQECKYMLLPYGIPVDTFPLQDGSDSRPFHTREVQKWIANSIRLNDARKEIRRLSNEGRPLPLLTAAQLIDVADEENLSLAELFEQSGQVVNQRQASSSEDLLWESLASFEVGDISDQEVDKAAHTCINENVKIYVEERTGDGTTEWITENPGTIIYEPDIRPEDVLLGQSRKLRKQEGNKFCREQAAKYYEAYMAHGTHKTEKTEIATMIVRLVNSSGGRFLKQTSTDEAVWVVVEEKEARNKVSNTFRNITSKKKQQEKQRNTDMRHATLCESKNSKPA